MRFSLLNYIACPACGEDLTLTLPAGEEIKDDPSYEIEEGLLTCEACGRWFPLHSFIPELLPDHLRDWARDRGFLNGLKSLLPENTFKSLWDTTERLKGESASIEDGGAHHKKSEMTIKDKVTDEGFFGPGMLAPFNPGNSEYTMHLLRRYANVLPLLEVQQGSTVLDIGAGYAWTSEWMKKMGIDAIGVDISRTYLDIGVKRMNNKPPHLVVGDIENLPLKTNVLDAVLCYDAFHHIPDRPKAMGHFYRTLKDTGNIVLAEPPGEHEYDEHSKEVMDKYGILEKGMDLEDVAAYCSGLKFLPPEQHYILETAREEQNRPLSLEFIDTHSYVDSNIYIVRKRPATESAALPSPSVVSRIKGKIKHLLKRFFYKYLK